MSRAIGPQSRVRLHYSITLEDGRVADATDAETPLEIELGTGVLHPNLEELLLGRRAGDKDVVTLSPEKGFGEWDEDLVQTLPRHDFPNDMSVSPGHIIGFETPGGDEVPGTILEVEENAIILDFNHPLSGHTLTIGLEILEVQQAHNHSE
ncbi:FKBP-type peptidyl-prolyl cis-trans isomerase [Acidihalobacter prosperus]